MRKAIDTVTELTSCDLLYLGGGNARKITFEPPAHVRIVSNTAGLTGGIRLWEPEPRRAVPWRARRGLGAGRQSEARGAMKALTIGGAMIDTIAIIASDRIERMSMLNADSSFLLLRGGAQDRGAGDLHACRRRGRECGRGHGAAGPRRGRARQARQGCSAPRRCWRA